MTELLPPPPLLAAFLGASLLLAVTPGPGVVYIIARSLAQGRRAGLASVAGVALGNLGNAIAAMAGLAALFSVSALAFQGVKLAGAAYLVYLGLRLLLARPAAPQSAGPVAGSLGRLFADGLLVALFNPKITLFFAAFLPQFISPGAAVMPQGLLLALAFVGVTAVTDAAYALAAGSLGAPLARRAILRRATRWLGGATFITLGVLAAVGGQRQRA